jgi:hypothetical protein
MPHSVDDIRKGLKLKIRSGVPAAYIRFLVRILEELELRGSDEVIFERDYLYVLLDGKYVKGGRLKAAFAEYLEGEGIEVSYDNNLVRLRRKG